MPPSPVEAIAIPYFNEFAAAVGFSRQEIVIIDTAKQIAAEPWRNDFAIMVIVRLPNVDETSLDDSSRAVSVWLGNLLKAEENDGRLIDGYQLIVLSTRPDDDLLVRIRSIEQDTTICRKHVLWPDNDLSWTRSLNSVTTLGLPVARSSGRGLTEPTIPEVAERALAERENGASFQSIATILEDITDSG